MAGNSMLRRQEAEGVIAAVVVAVMIAAADIAPINC